MKQGYVAKKRNTGSRKRRRIVLLAVEGNNKTALIFMAKRMIYDHIAKEKGFRSLKDLESKE